MITGTIRNSVNLDMLQCKWMRKKQEINSGTLRGLSEDEQEAFIFQNQVDEMRESKTPNDIDAKLQSGAKLTQEEIEYLRKNDPQALEKYENRRKEVKQYKEQLKHCKSKEDVENLKMTKTGEFLASCKEIANNPNIPKSAKLGLVKDLLGRSMEIEKEHIEFVHSAQYAKLPEDNRHKKDDREESVNEEITDEAATDAAAVSGSDAQGVQLSGIEVMASDGANEAKTETDETEGNADDATAANEAGYDTAAASDSTEAATEQTTSDFATGAIAQAYADMGGTATFDVGV